MWNDGIDSTSWRLVSDTHSCSATPMPAAGATSGMCVGKPCVPDCRHPLYHLDLPSLFKSLAASLPRVTECDRIGLDLPDTTGRIVTFQGNFGAGACG